MSDNKKKSGDKVQEKSEIQRKAVALVQKVEDVQKARAVVLHRLLHLQPEHHHHLHRIRQNDRSEHILDRDKEQAEVHSLRQGLFVFDTADAVTSARIAHRRNHRWANVVSRRARMQM